MFGSLIAFTCGRGCNLFSTYLLWLPFENSTEIPYLILPNEGKKAFQHEVCYLLENRAVQIIS